MALRTTKAAAQVAMISVIVVYYLTFISVGLSSAIVDRSLRQDNCGKSTHLWKYTMLNTIFATITLITYGSFPGGGEGARARALMVSILHFGLCVWGFLLKTSLPDCMKVVHSHYSQIDFFYGVCIWHNLVFCVLYVSHELFLGEWLGGDLTLIPEVRKHDTVDFTYHPHTSNLSVQEPVKASGYNNKPPTPSFNAVSTKPTEVPPLIKSAGGGGDEISKEYAVLTASPKEATPPKAAAQTSDPRLPNTPQRGL